MYFYYHSLAKLFRENLVSKAGDEANCRHIHINLMYYTHPSRLQKINGCALIYHELRRSVLKRMTPNYSQFVQRLINSRVPAGAVPRAGRITMEQLTLSLRRDYTEVPSMLPDARVIAIRWKPQEEGMMSTATSFPSVDRKSVV